MKSFRACLVISAIVALAGCASTQITVPKDVPTALRPPAGESVFLEALASGVQIYECAPKPEAPATYAWAFRAPEAALVDRSGRSIGKHYAGPTWESVDGSTVVGVLKAQDPGPSKTAIPWLLLATKSTTGVGILAKTTSVQRLNTVGGVAPADACTSTNAKQVARVPYTAVYYFYSAGLDNA